MNGFIPGRHVLMQKYANAIVVSEKSQVTGIQRSKKDHDVINFVVFLYSS